MADILYRNDNYMFSYRAGGILIIDGKILLQKPDNDNYSIVGGHVMDGETSNETIVREFKEEIKFDVEIDRMIAVGEIFFNWAINLPCHQIALYYNLKLKDEKKINYESFYRYDELGKIRYKIKYEWIELSKIKDMIIYPLEIKEIIIKNSKEIEHFISKQI